MYERRSQPVISRAQMLMRVLHSVRRAAVVVGVSLLAGIIGYHFLGHLNWVDSFLEASMILAGEGPINPLQNDAVKIFASCYALFSGFVLLAAAGIIVAPLLHRLMHSFHQDPQEK
jgi:hypothetical protein